MTDSRAPERDHLTVKEAAGMIEMSAAWLYLKIQYNVGPPIKKRGGRIFLPRHDFLAWAAKGGFTDDVRVI